LRAGLSEAEKVPKTWSETQAGTQLGTGATNTCPPSDAGGNRSGTITALPDSSVHQTPRPSRFCVESHSACRCRLARYTRSASTHTGRMRGYCAYGEDCDSVAHQGLMSQHACQQHRHQADPCAQQRQHLHCRTTECMPQASCFCRIEHVEHSGFKVHYWCFAQTMRP
jgi:hypothetical protein